VWTAAQANRPDGSGLWKYEVEIEGVTVRIGRGAQVKTVAAVLRALKAGA
jgi:transposase